MSERTQRQRIMMATLKKCADKLPFFHWWRHSQTGWAERECRNRGMGMSWARPSYSTKMHGVNVSETQTASSVSGQVVVRRTYSTPVGTVYLDEMRLAGVGQWHGLRSWNDIVPWQIERLIKGPRDYKVLKYITENTEYIPYYFPIEQAMDWLGDDGVVVDIIPDSPMQTLMTDWVGMEKGRFFIHHAKYADLVEDLYKTISRSREPLYEIAAKSPADIVLCGDHLEGILVNPRIFQKYFMPEYEKQGKVLHAYGKLMAVHMDGRVAVLKDLIAKTPIDIIEGLHPDPIGDLPIGQALSLWADKVVWMGFPGPVYALGPEATKKNVLKLLRDVKPGYRFAIEMSTENLISNDNLLMLTTVLENAGLPLTEEKLDRIERSLP